MDYSLAALKLLCVQLKIAKETPSQSSYSLDGILFQRVWLQGIIVSSFDDGNLLIDDGTGLINLALSGNFRTIKWDIGMYVMAVGAYFICEDELPMIKIHKMVDLSPYPDRESIWYLEVMEAHKLFYQAFLEEEEQEQDLEMDC
ncbi:uncharacterized protein LOC124916566 [Impatiens glandulifera]|uniref:uncharacterized protein LOC124916566 n=1 Tax=Impatiens glandulifera TaxID=253017 RepID=UPI001FB19891|nr:uncharacterized protein LOC124916566 [Impatiens glandulifera]